MTTITLYQTLVTILYFVQTYESAVMAPDWTSHVFTGPGRPGALEPVLASWDIQVSHPKKYKKK